MQLASKRFTRSISVPVDEDDDIRSPIPDVRQPRRREKRLLGRRTAFRSTYAWGARFVVHRVDSTGDRQSYLHQYS